MPDGSNDLLMDPFPPVGVVAAGAFVRSRTATISLTMLKAEATLVPPATRLWLGGAGATHLEGLPDGVEIIASLDDLDTALGRI